MATGLADMWAPLVLRVPFRRFNHLLSETTEPGFGEDESEIASTAPAEAVDLWQRAQYWVGLCDAWGVPLPFELLSRLMEKNEDDLAPVLEEAHDRKVLFWVEREKPPALLVGTAGERHARGYLTRLAAEEKVSPEDYLDIFRAVRSEEREERFTALKLLQSWLGNSRFRRMLFVVTDSGWILSGG